MQSTEQKLCEALQAGLHYAQEALDFHDTANQRHPSTEPERNAILDDIRVIAEALALPTDDVKSVLQSALNVLGCLEYGITGVDSWPCEDSVEDVIHRIRKVLEESQ